MKTSEVDKMIDSLRNLVSDVGVSQTTLEEVFMTVTGADGEGSHWKETNMLSKSIKGEELKTENKLYD